MVFFYDAETYRGLTAPAPSSSRCLTQRPPFLEEIKLLYTEQNYKRCASQCEKILQEQSARLQPLHETFLHFFIAICNESLALTAHKFSSKKLSFLSLAKDSFTAALVSVPLSRATRGSGSVEAHRALLPHSADLDRSGAHEVQDIRGSHFFGPVVSIWNGRTSETSQFLDERCDSGYDSGQESLLLCNDEKVPDFNDYTARRPLEDLLTPIECSTQPLVDEENLGSVGLEEDHLTPKPLFVKKTAVVVRAETSSHCQLLPLPLNTRGSQQRKIAITPPDAAPNVSSSTTSPGCLNQQRESSHRKPSSPILSTLYNTDLSLFRHQLSEHLSFIDQTIATTTHLQRQHKLNQNKRVASFWSFLPVINGAAEDEEDVKSVEKKERIERLREGGWSVTKERHGWKGQAFYEELRGQALAELRV